MLIATCSSDLIVILRRGLHSAVTQLRVIPLCESSFLEVHLARGVTFWVPTHAPHPLVTRPGSVSTFLSHHAPGSPLGMTLSWVVSIPGDSLRWRGYFTSQVTPTGTKPMTLKPPFSSLCYCSELHLNLAMLQSGDTLSWRRLDLATPHFGDASSWRRLILATSHLGDASFWRRVILATRHLGDASSWRRLILATPHFGDASSWRRVILATRHLGDVSSWRRLILATPHLGDASSWQRLILAMPCLGDA